MKKSKICMLIAVFAILVVGIPFFLDWCIIGNEFPSNITNSNWVNFFGGYIGALLGALFSLVGIFWTIKFTREQNRADRELQIRPYFDIRYIDVKNFCFTKTWLGYVRIDVWDSSDNCEQLNEVGAGLLHLKNIGNGPAMNIRFEVCVENLKTKHKAWFTNQNTKVTTNSVLPGEKAEVSFCISNSQQAPKNEDLVWEEGSIGPLYDASKYQIPNRFSVTLMFIYDDLMSNTFAQKLTFDVSYNMELQKGEDAKYHCELYLKSIGSPVVVIDE